MTTKDIYIGNNGTGRDEVLSEAESYAKENKLQYEYIE